MGSIDAAFDKFDRAGFMPAGARGMSGIDTALPIGYGQTISQPTTVRLMLEWLDPKPGEKILDVGAGSGWTTALLADIVGPRGRVYGVERIPELVDFGRDNIENAGVQNATILQAGDEYGLPEHAPYDRILVSASADKLPDELLRQLKPGGKMVIPVHESMLEITKNPAGKLDINDHPEFLFMFVPLI